MFICDFGVEHQFLSIIVYPLSRVFEFSTVESLAVNEFPGLCDELAGPFESRSFASYMCEIFLLCTCKVIKNEIENYRYPANAKDVRVKR